MKILHITATHLQEHGGVPSVLRKLIQNQNMIPNVESRLLSIVSKVSNSDEYFDFCTDIKRYLTDFNPDIAIIHSFYNFEYINVARILKKMKIEYYIEPHGSFVRNSFKKSFFRKKIANNTIFKNLIKGAKGYIYLSEEEKNKSVYHTKNDFIIKNGIDANLDIPTKSNEIKMYYIGRYDIKEKGINTILKALKMLDNQNYKITFDFFGIGSIKENKYIDKRIQKFKKVKCKNYGPIYGVDKKETIGSYNIMILVSRHEGMPMTFLEALNNGTPCIVSNEANVSNIIDKYNTGWITKNNAKDLSIIVKKAIKEYIDFKCDYINNCKKVINEEFNWKKIAEESIKKLLNQC